MRKTPKPKNKQIGQSVDDFVNSEGSYQQVWTMCGLHPGEHPSAQLEALGISAIEFARKLKIPAKHIRTIVSGKRALTADTALRLGHFFHTNPEFWLRFQTAYDLRRAEEKSGKAIKRLPSLNRSRARLGLNAKRDRAPMWKGRK